MKDHVTLVLGIILLGLTACSDAPGNHSVSETAAAPASRFAAADQMSAQKSSNPYLALTHDFRIVLPEQHIRDRFEATLDLCGQADFHGCTLIHASLNEGRQYPNANIQLRILNPGVEPLLAAASQNGKIASQTSRADDLTDAVMDADKRLEMLRSYQERLQGLEGQAANDIDALIKVSSELAQVQSDIERIEASRGQLQRRLDLDLVNIQFQADTQESFFTPLGRALDKFAYNLASGASSLISVFALVLPWALALALAVPPLRWLWRRRR